MITYAYGAKKPWTSNGEIVDQQIARAHRYHNILVEIARERRQAIEEAEGDKAKIAAANARSAARGQEERARCGLYWGTYLVIEGAVAQASRSGGEPQFARWEGEGTVAVQLQGGLTRAEILNGTDTRVRVTGDGKHRVLWIRVGSEGRAPVWATIPFIYHRELPPSVVKWVRVTRRKVATKFVHSVQFVLDPVAGAAVLPAPKKDTIAIDVGWRKLEQSAVRVAVWTDSTGTSGELRLPADFPSRMDKVGDLQAIRDMNFGTARATLAEARRESSHSWPKEFAERTRYLHAWKSPAKLATLIVRWRNQRFSGDEAIFEAAEAWRKQDKHLYEWECHQRENTLRSRREHYRLFALHTAAYKRIVIERLDLREFAKLPKKSEDEDPRITAARGRRFQAGLSELLGCIAWAAKRSGSVLEEVEPAWTTQTCAECGSIEPFDAGGSIEHTCSKCGATWDQDANAAHNLFDRAAGSALIPGARSRPEKLDANGLSPAAVRRAKGLATRRAKRSKVAGESTENTDESA